MCEMGVRARDLRRELTRMMGSIFYVHQTTQARRRFPLYASTPTNLAVESTQPVEFQHVF